MTVTRDTATAPLRAKVLIASSIGIGPPFHGNRARLRALLEALRTRAETSFVGLELPDHEYAALDPALTRPLANLGPSVATRLRRKTLDRIGRLLKRIIDKALKRRPAPAGNHPLDAGFDPRHLARLRALDAEHRFDAVIVVYAVHTAVLAAFPDRCLKVIETQDILTDRNAAMAKLGIATDWHSLSAADEARSLNRADVLLAIQHAEADYFRRLADPRVRVLTVRHLIAPKAVPLTASKGCVGIIASDNPINARSVLWFIDTVFSRLTAAGIDITLVLAGSICRLVQPDGRPIELLGEIANTDDFYRQVAVTVNPTIGGTGLKIKTIEAMSAGRGVIGGASAMVGLEDCIGHGLLIAETADDYLAVLAPLLASDDAVPALGQAAHDAAWRVYRESIDNLDALLPAAASASTTAAPTL